MGITNKSKSGGNTASTTPMCRDWFANFVKLEIKTSLYTMQVHKKQLKTQKGTKQCKVNTI